MNFSAYQLFLCFSLFLSSIWPRPPDNGCPDHYEPAGQHCIRASALSATYSAASEKCVAEGGSLLHITSQQMNDDITALLDEKRSKEPEFSQVSPPELFMININI